MKLRGNTETIVPVRAEVKPGFAVGIIYLPHIPKKNLMIASALINTDCDTPAVCEPVTKIFHHNEDLSSNSDEGIKRNLKIPALNLGHLTEH